MTPKIYLLIILSLLVFSCNKKNEKQELELKTEIKVELDSNKDHVKSAQLFAQEVLKENIRVHSFNISDPDTPDFLRIFQINGLEKIVAYSNKNYPKRTEPNHYEHFTLFVATYQSSVSAKNSFNQLKMLSKYSLTDLRNLTGDVLKKVKDLNIGIKSGGMITQNGKQVFSLVETCRETPIGLNWIDYENKFIEFITENGEEIEVLNADCGMMKYKIEKRKVSR